MSVSKDLQLLNDQLTIARSEINNLRQQLNALKQVHRKDLAQIQNTLDVWQCVNCKVNQGSAQAAPPPSDIISVPYIGTVCTQFPEKRGTPRQPGVCPDMTAKLTLSKRIFSNPDHALQGLQEFSHMWILFHFHKNDSTHTPSKVAPPRLNGVRTGVFATRSPHRPAPIGVSLVRIDRIADGSVYFSGVDMLDGTPVVDIKPYIPQYDDPRLSLSGSDSARAVDGEERAEVAVGAASLAYQNDSERFQRTRSVSRMGEREAPDGEEEEEQVRVPSWIDQPPVTQLNVLFKQRALTQLQQLGSEGDLKKTQITSVLRQDPRSVYLREHTDGNGYVFRIAELYVSCRFDDAEHTVTVLQVFQEAVQSED